VVSPVEPNAPSIKNKIMKFIYLLFCLASFALHGFAQTATVSGQIINPKGDLVHLRHYSNFITYEEVTIDSAVLDKKGNFKMQFPCAAAGFVTFAHGDEITEMYIIPGDDIQLTLDTKEFDESIRYTGKGAFVNTYLAQKYIQTPVPTAEIYKYSPEAFATYIDSTRGMLWNFSDQYFSQRNDLTPDELMFVELAKNNILYDGAGQKLTFPAYHGYVTGKRGFTPPAEYYNFLDGIPLVNASAASSYLYLEFLKSYVDYKLKTGLTAAPAADPNYMRDAIIDENWQGYLRDYLHTSYIYDLLSGHSFEEAESRYNHVKATLTTPAFIELLDQSFAAQKQLAPGQPAPDVMVTDPTGKRFHLSDFRGKAVYLDIWATWCGPCLREIPAMEKLVDEMAGADVVFLSISVDVNEAAWKKMVADKDMKGLHGISPGDFNAPIAKAYQVNGIPRYVLIDKEGKIANSNAPRPADVKQELEALLGR
jgi:thiol-disulfide isomerase/thioredoxin